MSLTGASAPSAAVDGCAVMTLREAIEKGHPIVEQFEAPPGMPYCDDREWREKAARGPKWLRDDPSCMTPIEEQLNAVIGVGCDFSVVDPARASRRNGNP